MIKPSASAEKGWNVAGKPDEDDLLAAFFDRSLAALELAAKDRDFPALITEIAHSVENSLRAGGKLMIAGNGSSAADAQHLAAEFLARFKAERRPLPALALTTDTSVLTAVGNAAIVQQIHIVAGHAIYGLGERAMLQ